MHIKVKLTRQQIDDMVRAELQLSSIHTLDLEIDQTQVAIGHRPSWNKIGAIKLLRDAIQREVGVIRYSNRNDAVSPSGFYIGLADAKNLVERLMSVLGLP